MEQGNIQRAENAISTVLSGNGNQLDETDISELIKGLLYSSQDVAKTVTNAICEDRQLKARVLEKFQETWDSIIEKEDQFTKQLLDSGDANSTVFRDLIGNTDISDERFKVCIDELRYYYLENKKIVQENHNRKQILIDKAVELQETNIRKENFVIPKEAVKEAALSIVENPYFQKMVGEFIFSLFRK